MMEGFVIFKYLHVASMFFAVALALSSELVLRQVANSRDVSAIRITAARVKPLANISTGLFLLGAAFGFVAAFTGNLNLLAPWLLLAYAAFVTAMAIGITVSDPWAGRLEKAAEASPADGPSEALNALIDEPAARAATWALIFLTALLVFTMVVKPLS